MNGWQKPAQEKIDAALDSVLSIATRIETGGNAQKQAKRFLGGGHTALHSWLTWLTFKEPPYGEDSLQERTAKLRELSDADWQTRDDLTTLLGHLGKLAAGRVAADNDMAATLKKIEGGLRGGGGCEPPKLDWRRAEKRLYYDGAVAREWQRIAPNQFAVLDAFQELDWPLEIDDPLSGGCDDPTMRVRETVRKLNRSMMGLAFSSNGRGTGFSWSPSQK